MKQKFKNVFYEIKKAWVVCKALSYIFIWPVILIIGFICWCNDIVKGLNS